MEGTSKSGETIKNCETGLMGGTLPSANIIHTIHATVISFARPFFPVLADTCRSIMRPCLVLMTIYGRGVHRLPFGSFVSLDPGALASAVDQERLCQLSGKQIPGPGGLGGVRSIIVIIHCHGMTASCPRTRKKEGRRRCSTGVPVGGQAFSCRSSETAPFVDLRACS